MVIKICPRCQRRVLTEHNEEDIIHECNSANPTIDNEDVVVNGDWEDFTGSGVEVGINFRGAENKLFGTRAGIEGNNLEEFTTRGNRASTTRQRQYLQFIKLKGGEC